MTMSAGSRKQIEFIVYNESKTEPAFLNIFTTDIIQTIEGSYQVAAIGEGVNSCAQWIKLKDSIVYLKPDSAKAINGYIQVPYGVSGGGYGAIVVENRLSANEAAYKIRIPIIVKIRLKPLIKPKALITGLQFEEGEQLKRYRLKGSLDNWMSIAATVKNECDVHLNTTGILIIKNKKGSKIRQVPLGKEGGVILPNSTVNIRSIIVKPKAGEYIAEAIIKYGERGQLTAKMPFEVTKSRVIAKGKMNASLPLGVIINPENISMSIMPNAVRNRMLIFTNEEKFDLKVNAEVVNVTNAEDGEWIAVDKQMNDKWSCADWLSLETNEFILKAGEKKPLKINIKVPASKEQGERFCQIKIKMQKDSSLPTEVFLPVILKYAGNFQEELEISDINIINKNPLICGVSVRNVGETGIKATGKVSIQSIINNPDLLGEITKPIGEYKIRELNDLILPNKTVRLHTTTIPPLTKGKYRIIAEIEYGKGKYLNFQKDFNM